jgi:hypothetical protein
MERKCVCHQVYEKCDKRLELVYVQFWVSVTEGTANDVLLGRESNENFKSAIKVRNTAQLSCKLTTLILMV